MERRRNAMPNTLNLTRRGFVETALATSAASTALGATSAMTNSFAAGSPTVTTKQGAVRGTFENGIAVFRGIPYAEPPVGKRRFKPPVRVGRWAGVRDATKFGAITPQSQHPMEDMCFSPGTAMGDDCLNLNVWTPVPGASRLPVFVWIHGGSFQWGTGSGVFYAGENFARSGVVCVTINYRLAAAGFLNVGDKPGTGAFGLLDQIAALEWVQENIAAFGGDPAQVTIAGESAGGFSVGHLLGAPAARRLFRRAVAQSGGAHLHINRKASALIGETVMARLGLRPGDDDAIAGLKTKDLIAAQSAIEATFPALMAKSGAVTDPIAFALVAMVPTYGADVLPVPAVEAIARGASRDVDLLIGTNKDEASVFWPSSEVQAYARPTLQGALDVAFRNAGRTGADVLAAYPQPAVADVVSGIVPAGTDMVFRTPSIRVAEAKLAHNPNTWMYMFSWPGALGATHAIEVAFMFDTLDRSPAAMKSLGAINPPRALAKTMHGAWVNFAKTGTPHHASLPAWPRYDLTRRATMDLNVTSRVVDDPESDRRKLWAAAGY
jgi:para-nitrobenzyl esterase